MIDEGRQPSQSRSPQFGVAHPAAACPPDADAVYARRTRLEAAGHQHRRSSRGKTRVHCSRLLCWFLLRRCTCLSVAAFVPRASLHALSACVYFQSSLNSVADIEAHCPGVVTGVRCAAYVRCALRVAS